MCSKLFSYREILQKNYAAKPEKKGVSKQTSFQSSDEGSQRR